MTSRVVYRCTVRRCGLRTPYKPGKLERLRGACGGPLRAIIESDDDELKETVAEAARFGMLLSHFNPARGNIAPAPFGAPRVESLVTMAAEVDAAKRALRIAFALNH